MTAAATPATAPANPAADGSPASPHVAFSTPATEAAQDEATRKRWATLAAALALRGFELRRLDSGAWVVSRWHLCRDLPTLADAERFAAQVGATA